MCYFFFAASTNTRHKPFIGKHTRALKHGNREISFQRNEMINYSYIFACCIHLCTQTKINQLQNVAPNMLLLGCSSFLPSTSVSQCWENAGKVSGRSLKKNRSVHTKPPPSQGLKSKGLISMYFIIINMLTKITRIAVIEYIDIKK